jgi:hypothetical protein
MSLLGTSYSVSVSHFSGVTSVQVIFDFLSASEYWNESTDPATRPYTPRSRGPSLSRSRASASAAAFFERLFAATGRLAGSKPARAHHEQYERRADCAQDMRFALASTSYSVPPALVTEPAEASVESTTARLCFFMTDCTSVIPNTLRSLSSATFMGPGWLAGPGAACGNAVDMAVWNMTFPSVFCITWWMCRLSTVTDPNRFR